MTVTIELTKTTEERLRADAELRGMSFEDYVAQQLESEASERPVRKFRSTGVGRSGRTDTSVRLRKILRGEAGEE
ncbi:hypothetical protein ACFO4E_26185 [Nocardiopsis mangrovi]|uniref:Antitoxin n=1 Tax=Nocardiopsis mangrovi TaxID=1179818 RepID=A0ABV9E2F7_9ACTN